MDIETRQCQNCKSAFTVEPDDFAFYGKIQVPPPTDCPECRQRDRIIFRNFKTFYKRPSDKSKRPLISMYSAAVPFPVWSHEEWWADDWDTFTYGRDFDFSRPFFAQFQELLNIVPRFAMMNTQSERCEYSNFTLGAKDCYLIFGCVDDEQCGYGHIVWNSKDSYDNLYVFKSELCYECIDCIGGYRLAYAQECESCAESIGLYDCRSCTNCIGCVGLKQKTYYVFNEPVGKEGYEKFLREHPLSDPRTISLILRKQAELRRTLPQRHFFGSHNVNVSGNHIYNAKNVRHSFDVKGGEDSKYVFTARKAIGTYDTSFLPDIEQSYQVLTATGTKIFFSHIAMNSHDVYYSDAVYGSHDLFGCVGVRNGEYAILNKKYSKEQYDDLKQRIIDHMRKTGEWGQFFPRSMSPFAYNESIVAEYYPLAKDEALAQGYRWEDDIPSTTGQETIHNDELPARSEEYDDGLLKHILKCDECGKNYRFIAAELGMYRSMQLPLPRSCPNCRHRKRMQLRNPRRLWAGACAACHTNFETSYPPEAQKTIPIYCEACYQKELG